MVLGANVQLALQNRYQAGLRAEAMQHDILYKEIMKIAYPYLFADTLFLCAGVSFKSLQVVFEECGNPEIKAKVFDATVLPAITYGTQTWAFTKRSSEKLRIAHAALERALVGITLREQREKGLHREDIRKISKVRDPLRHIAKQKHGWAGHTARREDDGRKGQERETTAEMDGPLHKIPERQEHLRRHHHPLDHHREEQGQVEVALLRSARSTAVINRPPKYPNSLHAVTADLSGDARRAHSDGRSNHRSQGHKTDRKKPPPPSSSTPKPLTPPSTPAAKDAKFNKYKTRRIDFRLCALNARTLCTDTQLDHLVQELDKYKYDVLGLCETKRRHGKKAIHSTGTGIYLGKRQDGSTSGGVGFIVAPHFVHRILDFKTIDHRIAILKFRVNKRTTATVVQGYAPTADATDDEREEFYDNLRLVARRNRSHNMFVCGDFNATVGEGRQEELFIGKHSADTRNEAGESLAAYCETNKLLCYNNFFEKPAHRRWTHANPTDTSKREIDFILGNRKCCTDVHTVPSFDIGSDHRLLRAHFHFSEKKEMLDRKKHKKRTYASLDATTAASLSQRLPTPVFDTSDISKDYDLLIGHISAIESACLTTPQNHNERRRSKTSKGSHEIVKLTSIRSDTRYSANTIIYKLISNYEISKVMIKLTDIKKIKSIKRVSLYYSAKSVESVDSKLHPELWRKCAVVAVGDTDTVITLSLVVPVVTSSLIIEFGEVVDSRGSSQLHCPRCSGPVRTQSGVCESCGEFQCMKCRAINYVDREPFLCQSCGFCKYARIELSAVCRALPGAQHITSDVERGQCVQEITQLLTKMETTKTKLSGYRAVCESLFLRSRPLAPYKLHVENSHTSEFFEANGTMSVDQQSFQSITLPMNALASAIRVLHHDLCQQTQQLMYLHEELNRYDHASEVSVVFHKPQNNAYYSTSETCFGCLCNQLLHSIALLHSSCEDENAHNTILHSNGLISRTGTLSNSYETLREESEELLVRLMFGRTDVTAKVEGLIQSGHVGLSVMVKSLMYAADPTWQQKLKLLIRHAIEKRDESSCLQALMVLNKYLEGSKNASAEEKKKVKITPTSTIIQWITTDDDWKDCCSVASTSTAPPAPVPSNTYQWISSCLFSQWMNVRSAANQLLVNLSRQHFHEPVALLMLCENLSKLSELPSSICDQFMSSAHTIIDSSVNTKARLFVQQFHVYLIKRIHEECANLHSQSVSLLSDNTFGERLRCFVELLSLLLSGSNVENVLLKAGADDLLIFLLHSTIFLKRMLTRRTRAIDSSRMALEKLLRRVSSRDGSKLMGVCVESLKLVKDASTLGIIVGVMMEIMNPTQETEETFLMQIEKDVAQEDFLQGRMTHNPYSSPDQGMGPLMRDIKNKICRDTEMIALMEDDNGMELLVGGNIISLSLNVREVYDRLWKRNNNGSPMLIIYRMRGLMGDAVETFIENFGAGEGVREEDEEDEQLVRTIQCLMPCGGLDKLMDLLTTNIETSSGRFLLAQLRKIFDRIVRTKSGRKALVERRIVERMMSVIRTCCADPTNESKVQIGMELYKVVEFVVSDKNVHAMLSGILETDATWWFGLFEKRGSEEGSTTENHRKTAQILDQMMPKF